MYIEILDEDGSFIYKDKTAVYDEIKETLERKSSIYAGDGSYVAQWYKSEGFMLEEIDKEIVLQDLSEYIWNKYS